MLPTNNWHKLKEMHQEMCSHISGLSIIIRHHINWQLTRMLKTPHILWLLTKLNVKVSHWFADTVMQLWQLSVHTRWHIFKSTTSQTNYLPVHLHPPCWYPTCGAVTFEWLVVSLTAVAVSIRIKSKIKKTCHKNIQVYSSQRLHSNLSLITQTLQSILQAVHLLREKPEFIWSLPL